MSSDQTPADASTWATWTPEDDAEGIAAATAPQEAAQAPEDTVPDDPEASDEQPDPITELRGQLETVTSELAEVRALVALFRRTRAESIASENLIDARDLWRHGIDLDTLIGPGGDVDPEAVGEAVDRILADAPHLARPQTPPRIAAPPVARLRSGASQVDVGPSASAPTWGSAFRSSGP